MKRLFPTLTATLILACGAPALPVDAVAQDTRGQPAAQMVTVPNLQGKTLTEAIRILNAAGLGRQTQLSDRDGELRIVIRQDPRAGAVVPRGTVVSIYGQRPTPLILAPGRTTAQPVTGDDKGTVNLHTR